jgi:hypothetical protein
MRPLIHVGGHLEHAVGHVRRAVLDVVDQTARQAPLKGILSMTGV